MNHYFSTLAFDEFLQVRQNTRFRSAVVAMSVIHNLVLVNSRLLGYEIGDA